MRGYVPVQVVSISRCGIMKVIRLSEVDDQYWHREGTGESWFFLLDYLFTITLYITEPTFEILTIDTFHNFLVEVIFKGGLTKSS